jgi:DNA invertase Pin-like site-specific DNA recombinase
MDSTISPPAANNQTKSDRIRAGLNRARAQGKRIGRPPVIVSPEQVLRLRQAGYSWAKIVRSMRAGSGTVRRAYRAAINAAGACQKPTVEVR